MLGHWNSDYLSVHILANILCVVIVLVLCTMLHVLLLLSRAVLLLLLLLGFEEGAEAVLCDLHESVVHDTGAATAVCHLLLFLDYLCCMDCIRLVSITSAVGIYNLRLFKNELASPLQQAADVTSLGKKAINYISPSLNSHYVHFIDSLFLSDFSIGYSLQIARQYNQPHPLSRGPECADCRYPNHQRSH